MRPIVRRHRGIEHANRAPRTSFYPVRRAWEEESFGLTQVDTTEPLDKGMLATRPWDHLRKHRLPRYQWTSWKAERGFASWPTVAQ